MLKIVHICLKQGSDTYLERLLPGQLLCGGGAVLLNTIKHPGLRLEGGGREETRESVRIKTRGNRDLN